VSDPSIYAKPRDVASLDDCGFYHTMDIPGYGLVEGAWDLREGLRDYLGGVDLEGKRVLEMGTASGFLCFSMEALGAEVVAFDIADDQSWDIVPFSGADHEALVALQKDEMRKVKNSFWLAHKALNSKARVVYGSVYDVPEAIGPVDVTTFTAILLHLRDPFYALENALRLTTETVIITERPPRRAWPTVALSKVSRPLIQFLPNRERPKGWGTWWRFTPQALMEMIAVMGFEDAELSYHQQQSFGRKKRLYTIVGRRTKG
jgi:hypothetical protein